MNRRAFCAAPLALIVPMASAKTAIGVDLSSKDGSVVAGLLDDRREALLRYWEAKIKGPLEEKTTEVIREHEGYVIRRLHRL